ncbi:hypothetical protein [Rhodococcus xishaensis]|uniref:Uncharacterized protein n=1 Tax=Rhodococcus xishaensis TaxID=2487364 RepID=A0A3S3ZJ88_9NOCA|nr:hypothetical protein [Rhodococcus xishaensis]RVW01973.1 hypothetical protein EGT50_11030 [Rhodococcus xishaensis]
MHETAYIDLPVRHLSQGVGGVGINVFVECTLRYETQGVSTTERLGAVTARADQTRPSPAFS